MLNYVILTGIIASEISFKTNCVTFRLKLNNPVFLNISCIAWKEELFKELKMFSKNKNIKICGMLKSNNYYKVSNIVESYEIVITKILET